MARLSLLVATASLIIAIAFIASVPSSAAAAASSSSGAPWPIAPNKWSGCWSMKTGNYHEQYTINITATEWPADDTISFTGTWQYREYHYLNGSITMGTLSATGGFVSFGGYISLVAERIEASGTEYLLVTWRSRDANEVVNPQWCLYDPVHSKCLQPQQSYTVPSAHRCYNSSQAMF